MTQNDFDERLGKWASAHPGQFVAACLTVLGVIMIGGWALFFWLGATIWKAVMG